MSTFPQNTIYEIHYSHELLIVLKKFIVMSIDSNSQRQTPTEYQWLASNMMGKRQESHLCALLMDFSSGWLPTYQETGIDGLLDL